MTAGLSMLVLLDSELVLDTDDVSRVRAFVIGLAGRRARRCGVDIEDVVQEALVHVLRAQARPGSRWDPGRGSSWEGHLFQLARSGAANAFRRPRRWARGEVGEIPEMDRPDPGPTADQALGVRDALALLDSEDEQRMAQMLADGLTPREMRAATGWDAAQVDTVRARVRLAMEVVRAQ